MTDVTTATDLVAPRATVDLPATTSTYDDVADILQRLGAPTSNTLKVTQSKTFQLPDGTESPGPLPYVIVDFIYENRYYDTPFNRKKPVPPVCAALNPKVTLLAPLEQAPQPQASTCTGCPQNKFGTAQNGNGKACTNAVLIALLDPQADPDAPLLRLRTSPTGIGPFEMYIRGLATKLKAPFNEVLTWIGFDPNSEYSSLRFGNPRSLRAGELELDDKKYDGMALLALAKERQAEARELLMTAPDFTPPETSAEPQVRGSRRATA